MSRRGDRGRVRAAVEAGTIDPPGVRAAGTGVPGGIAETGAKAAVGAESAAEVAERAAEIAAEIAAERAGAKAAGTIEGRTEGPRGKN
ncbi:MAG: hypothetical protein CL908_16815 [Deltaproteobacteria bacterium]|jgi:hypothetical protein|nr:hypothetical protein [Deltaproteobacteria bacterium]